MEKGEFICSDCLMGLTAISVTHNGKSEYSFCHICKAPCQKNGFLITEFKPKQYSRPMEKQIKMSLETARKFYNNTNGYEGNEQADSMRAWLLENFTKEELEGKKGFVWEDSFRNEGFVIDWYSKVGEKKDMGIVPANHHLFKTEQQALSALAFAQLSYIVAKYNDGEIRSQVIYKIRLDGNGKLGIIDNHFPSHLEFYAISDARLSLEVNRELWEQYWMISK